MPLKAILNRGFKIGKILISIIPVTIYASLYLSIKMTN
jgi:hypothetical protein